ncbi:MAG: lysophospholipid acyltransferase family protein, partial [Deltaproteobacteria bacterium]|nr:lysophospholipid acyltransferase family protein [Deltaproteobacteria bacterium]
GICETVPACSDSYEFARKALDALDVTPVVSERDLKAIPSSGPAVVIANHPFGGVDGLILASVLSSARKDIRILVNYFLGAIPDLQPIFFLVDPFGRKDSPSKNMAAMRKALRWVRKGGMLVVFPAGEVSHLTWKSRKVQDSPWSEAAARLIHLTQAPVVPVFFEGRNSGLFQAAGLIHPRLRTLMLPRELLRKRASRVRLRIGNSIPYRRLKVFETASDLNDYLRFRTDLLRYSLLEGKRRIPIPLKIKRPVGRAKKVICQQDPLLLRREVETLPRSQKLAGSNGFEVYFARANQAPRLLQEIGRLREETFRLAGEGTGKSVDLDRFDNIYLHLFVWNRDRHEVVGAYRMGATDDILKRHGRKGLYTQTLFKYRPALLREINPALELGRSFVRKEYQRSYSPLLLLWKGIGQYVAAYPRYRVLFGAVSISNDYHSYSRQLMVAFLNMNRSLPDLQGMVKPRKPFRQKKVKAMRWVSKDPDGGIEELSSWISGVERDGKGVPILLKQYLKLGGSLLSFNVDRKFKNALDGLVLVDLTLTDPKTLRRYMGDEGYDSFIRYNTERSLRLKGCMG